MLRFVDSPFLLENCYQLRQAIRVYVHIQVFSGGTVTANED